MKIVVLTSLPRPSLLPRDFLPYYLQRHGIPVAAVIARRIPWAQAVRAHVSSGGILQRLPQVFRTPSPAPVETHAPLTPRAADTPRTPIPLHYVDDHNGPACLDLLKSLAPDVVVLGGTGIIKPALLALPRIGTLGCHYALLPEFRGFNVTEWAILEGRPVGVSILWVDAGVDTGDVLMDRRVVIRTGETIATLRRRSAELGKQLFVESLRRVMEGDQPRRPQRLVDGRQFYRMHPRLIRAAEQKLAALAG